MKVKLKAATIHHANQVQDEFVRAGLPGHMWDGVELYLTQGIVTGDFLIAIFENSLARTAAHADHVNCHLLFEWATFMHNAMPGNCWGNPDKVKAWAAHGGMNRTPQREYIAPESVDGLDGQPHQE